MQTSSRALYRTGRAFIGILSLCARIIKITPHSDVPQLHGEQRAPDAKPAHHHPGADAHARSERRKGRDEQACNIEAERKLAADQWNGRAGRQR
jgi:hypothetical protein